MLKKKNRILLFRTGKEKKKNSNTDLFLSLYMHESQQIQPPPPVRLSLSGDDSRTRNHGMRPFELPFPVNRLVKMSAPSSGRFEELQESAVWANGSQLGLLTEEDVEVQKGKGKKKRPLNVPDALSLTSVLIVHRRSVCHFSLFFIYI